MSSKICCWRDIFEVRSETCARSTAALDMMHQTRNSRDVTYHHRCDIASFGCAPTPLIPALTYLALYILSTMSGTRQVFVDPADTDNPLMCLTALKEHPDALVEIVLSPRPVDFKAKPYGGNFKRFTEVVGIDKMMIPLTEDPEWAKDLDDEMRPYFYRDVDFSDEYVREDAYPYMCLTAFRFASFFEDRGIPRERYVFYFDESSVDQDKVKPGMRHAIHVPDYSYDFDPAELLKFKTARDAATGEVRRAQLLAVCHDYIERQAQRFGYSDPKGILHNFDDLIERKKSEFSSSLLIGGPFTEALRYVEELPVSDICAMAFYIHGESNLFKNQYNALVDMPSAKQFLRCVEEMAIPFSIVPTECIKGSPYQLDAKELAEVFQPAPLIYAMIERFTAETNTLKSVVLYDWVAALYQTNRWLLPSRRVEWFTTHVDGIEVIKFRESSKGSMRMCWNDHGYMQEKKSDLMRLMKSTVAAVA